jgi:hypothetical protein
MNVCHIMQLKNKSQVRLYNYVANRAVSVHLPQAVTTIPFIAFLRHTPAEIEATSDAWTL